MGDTIRIEDLFARYGGEEFICMPRGELNNEKMYILCEHIRESIGDFNFYFGETCIKITASYGFYIKKVEGVDLETMLHDLIGKADQALYLAKERGRNRTESFI